MKYIKKTVTFSFILLLNNCVSQNNSMPLYFSNYDNIVYYYNPAYNIHNIDRESFLKIYTEDTPSSSSEFVVMNELEKFGYQKKEIEPDYFDKVNKIFRVKKLKKKIIEHNCIPQYRDILIFSKDNNITGVVKICFECKKIIAINSNSSFYRNYQKDEYIQLLKILGK